MKYLAIHLLSMSALAFVLVGLDKAAAILGRRRIAERLLLGVAALGGWPGTFIGLRLFRHKTRKAAFIRLFFSTAAVNTAGVVALLIWLLKGGP